MPRGSSIGRQVALRLLVSLGLLVALIASGSLGIYHAALHQAGVKRAEELSKFYAARLDQLERDWEIQTRDFKVRIEYQRALENPATATEVLQAFMTIQGTDRRFQHLLIQARDGTKVFEFGKDLALDAIPESAKEAVGHYLDEETPKLYRVFVMPIWLGESRGTGRLAAFFALDNAQLGQLAAPGITLSVAHNGHWLASSGGEAVLDRLRRGDGGKEREMRELPWAGIAASPILLGVEAPVVTLFSKGELALGMSAIPLIDGLVLWFTIGLWLTWQARRVTRLGDAVRAFVDSGKTTATMATALAEARRGKPDEIAAVADTLDTMAADLERREMEREAAMAQLRESERNLREITASLADGLLVVEVGGTISFVNPQAERLLGWSEEELLGRDAHATLHAHAAVERCPVHAALKDKTDFHSEQELFRRKDGKLIPVALTARPLHVGDTLNGVVVSFQDISERLAAEQELRESRERLAAATQAGIIGVWDWDIANDKLVWDDAMYRLYGLEPGDFGGAYEAWTASVHPDDSAHAEAEIQAALRGEREFEPEFRIVWPDGSIRYLKAASKTQRDAAGRPLRMIGINYDQTEQKQAAQKIAELNDFNSKIIHESPLGIAVYNADGDCVLANEALARIVGAMLAQVLAQNFHHIGSWRDSGLEAAAQRALDTGEKQRVETRVVTTFGKEIWISADFVALRRGGQPHVMTVMTDVSSFRRAEQVLREAKAAADNANRAKSEFLANMSHEIRTPMNAIIGLSDLALGLPDLSARLRDYLGKIYSSSKALLNILNDILDYSKVEAGRLELDAVPFEIEGVMQSINDLFGVRAEQKGVELLFEVGADVPPTLLGDPLRLGQVLNNLVGNAVKFTESGEIHICVQSMGVSEDGTASLHFSVRDSGIGMSPAQMDNIFHPFTQADGSVTRRFGGTGLGLTIAKRLVEKMGGDISVESEPGKGSCFQFTARLSVVARGRIERSPTALRGMRVLVVDDVETSRLILHDLLSAWGFEVTVAASGGEALECLESAAGATGQGYEMVLVDWKMPEMDGLEVARHVHDQVNRKVLARMPVIIMVTAYSREQLLLAARDVHLDAVLTKPVTPSGLFDTIIGLQGGQQLPGTVQAEQSLFDRAAAIRGARILLVEDNEINQTVARDLLERMGLHVVVAGDGVQALEILELDSFDAVLMDLQMPVMDGFEAARRIRQQERLAYLPVIAMTAAVLERDREACASAGMNAHVAKPIVPAELLATLIEWIAPAARRAPPADAGASPAEAAPELPDHLPGFQLEEAAARLGGNRRLLRNLIAQFGDQYAEVATELAGNLARGEREAAAAVAHRMKGVAGNIGARQLLNSAAKLEAVLEAEAGPADLSAVEEFNRALALALDAAKSLPTTTTTAAGEAYDCARCDLVRGRRLIGELRTLLANDEFVPQDLVAELEQAFTCSPIRSAVAKLRRCIDAIDYGRAIAVIDDLSCRDGVDLKAGQP